MVVSLKIKRLPYDPTIPILGTYQKKSRSRDTNRRSYPHVHSSIIHNCQTVAAARVPLNRCRDGQNVVLRHTMEYYPVLERKEIQVLATTWVNLGVIMLSKISQPRKDKYYMILCSTQSNSQKEKVECQLTEHAG